MSKTFVFFLQGTHFLFSIYTSRKMCNQNSLKSSKLLSQQIRKHNYKTLGTSVINSPLFPLSLSDDKDKIITASRSSTNLRKNSGVDISAASTNSSGTGTPVNMRRRQSLPQVRNHILFQLLRVFFLSKTAKIC